MKFDTVVIGGGLAGLVCGIRLARQGQKCVIVSAGQSALHFSSGSLDLLNSLPDGTSVEYPLQAIDRLAALAPRHPYAKLGKERFGEWAARAERFFAETGIAVEGGVQKNHYRVTPMGTLKATWLTLGDQYRCEAPDRLPWKKVAIFNVTGFLDFYTQFIADEFRKLGTASCLHEFSFPALEQLRRNPTEMRSTNIARVFDRSENLDELVRIIQAESGDAEAVVLPSVLGLDREDLLKDVQRRVGKPVCLLPTLPPSVAGIRAQQQLRKCFQGAGGVYMLGDTVLRAECEGNKVGRLYSCNHGDIPFRARHFVLATGSYFSQGLMATPGRVYEPVFGLDIASLGERESWYSKEVFDAQPYQRFGVKTDETFRGIREGELMDNLYVAGAVLEGFNAIKEGCGGGVSALTALFVADKILNQ